MNHFLNHPEIEANRTKARDLDASHSSSHGAKEFHLSMQNPKSYVNLFQLEPDLDYLVL